MTTTLSVRKNRQKYRFIKAAVPSNLLYWHLKWVQNIYFHIWMSCECVFMPLAVYQHTCLMCYKHKNMFAATMNPFVLITTSVLFPTLRPLERLCTLALLWGKIQTRHTHHTWLQWILHIQYCIFRNWRKTALFAHNASSLTAMVLLTEQWNCRVRFLFIALLSLQRALNVQKT